MRVTNGQNSARRAANAKETPFGAAVARVGQNDTTRVEKREARLAEIDAVFLEVRIFFPGIPFERHCVEYLLQYGQLAILFYG